MSITLYAAHHCKTRNEHGRLFKAPLLALLLLVLARMQNRHRERRHSGRKLVALTQSTVPSNVSNVQVVPMQ